jgi:hypothetical protein
MSRNVQVSGRARLPLWVVPHLQGLRLGTIECTYTHTYLYRTCLTNTPSCFHFRHTLVSLPCPSTPLSPCSPPTFCWRASYFPSSFRGHLQGQSELPLSHRRRRCLCLWPPWPPCQAHLCQLQIWWKPKQLCHGISPVLWLSKVGTYPPHYQILSYLQHIISFLYYVLTTNEPYSKISSNFNPMHANPYFAAHASLPSTIMHETVMATGVPDHVLK